MGHHQSHVHHDLEEDHGNHLDEMDVENTLSQRDNFDVDDVGDDLFVTCVMFTCCLIQLKDSPCSSLLASPLYLTREVSLTVWYTCNCTHC